MTLQSVITLTMVFVSGLLLVVMAAQAALLVVLLAQGKKLDGAAESTRRLANVAADCSVLRKELNALDELVSVKLNRIATTNKRAARKAVEEEPDDDSSLPRDLEFPGLFKREN